MVKNGIISMVNAPSFRWSLVVVNEGSELLIGQAFTRME